ncbi:TVP38/TMEM64 family protein [Aquisalibacillus elongatus]|uniref:TVP38/TMEM64 family membrane protein n=1 Tax=Aquisalibacillus elongatus TaxID=485577 RepID=A0A3N5CE12_9BACI|nr:VTT domain-containing protein [Aquisalibacillus elongatus]RPF55411.1 putative membrane protein YdjX (TVP38/TMEM64 family) [Aquisalibacillus elongatus]
MENVMTWVQDTLSSYHYAAPMLFIFFHLIRPFLFVPVAFICITGGLIFGLTYGAIYSLIGVTLSSLIFYFLIRLTPALFERFHRLREKMFGRHQQLSFPQVLLLRVTPFIHFHLVSICLIEMTRNFKEYAKLSILSNVPLAVLYTSFGQWFQALHIHHVLVLLTSILVIFYMLRKKEIVMKWEDFFTPGLQK